MTTKIGRGELFEALDGLSFIRVTVLGPLVLLESGARPFGVRKIEKLAPGYSQTLQATLANYNAFECLRALRACADSPSLFEAIQRASNSAVRRRKRPYDTCLKWNNGALQLGAQADTPAEWVM